MEQEQDYRNALLGTRARQRITIPETEIEVEMRVLSAHESMEAQQQKKSYLEQRNLSENQMCDVIEETVQTMFRACLMPNTDTQFFKAPDDLRLMQQETLLYLYDQYMILSNKHNPNVAELDKNQLEDLKKKLLNGEDLTGLNYFQLQSLCSHLADSLSTFESPAKSSSDAESESSPQHNGQSGESSTEKSPETSSDSKSNQKTSSSSQTKEEASIPQI